jgi:hypothetical protein
MAASMGAQSTDRARVVARIALRARSGFFGAC